MIKTWYGCVVPASSSILVDHYNQSICRQLLAFTGISAKLVATHTLCMFYGTTNQRMKFYILPTTLTMVGGKNYSKLAYFMHPYMEECTKY